MAGLARGGRWTERRGWMVAFCVAAGVHAAVYQQLTHGNPLAVRPDTPPLVTVSLVTSAAEPETHVPVAQPVIPAPPPEPVASKPEPRPEPKPRPRPVRKPPAPVPVATPVESVPSPSLPQAIATAASPAAGQYAALDAPVEAPRADAAYLKNPPPAYPKRLLHRGIEGSVLVRAQVRDDGSCSQVQLKESSGFRPFDDAALAAVRDWRFVPARQGGETVVAWVDVPIEFRITRSR